MTQTFGFLLRQYRNKSINPQTGRRLSQEALGTLIGKELGTPYSAQAVSDWERDRSQIHKDHRQVLLAIIQIFHACGGMSSPDEAEALLAAGNYRALTQAEVESIFLAAPLSPTRPNTNGSADLFLTSLSSLKEIMTPKWLLKVTMGVLGWVATWLSIAPILNFSNTEQSQRLYGAVMVSISGLAMPGILTWLSSLNNDRPRPLATHLRAYFTSLLGFSLGLTNILALALITYNMALYPWPDLLTFGLSLWPIALGLASADLMQQSENSEQRSGYRWFILALPLLISTALHALQPALSDRLIGPLLSVGLSLALGLLLWSQTKD